MGVSRYSAEGEADYDAGSDHSLAGRTGSVRGSTGHHGESEDRTSGGGSESDQALDSRSVPTDPKIELGQAITDCGDRASACSHGELPWDPGATGWRSRSGEGRSWAAAAIRARAIGFLARALGSFGMAELLWRAASACGSTIRWLVSWALILPILLYQKGVSPFLGPRCRFYPSCSHYAVGAIRKYGPARGAVKGVRRVMRCHPWNPGGYDPP